MKPAMKFRKPFYTPSLSWVVMEVIKLVIINFGIGYLFYNSLVIGICLAPISAFLFKSQCEKYKLCERQKIQEEFGEFIAILSGNLNAGYSLENAFCQSTVEYEKNKGQETIFIREIKRICNGLSCNVKLPVMLNELGIRSENEEITEFAQMLGTAKEHGGNMIKLIRQTSFNLNQKNMVENEIDTLISAKRMEGTMMILAPFIMVLYMRMTNGEYMKYLYNTGGGRIIMTFSLLIILLCSIWIRKITRIEV